ncbi:hypothetical protein UPYG_G00095090 [Umbra pygmaea]|uniref:Uncharacterized protein n=1 Tax=Umbra pygmaea TaxID=75934 RepID=A0ABD0XHL1_UMBPY
MTPLYHSRMAHSSPSLLEGLTAHLLLPPPLPLLHLQHKRLIRREEKRVKKVKRVWKSTEGQIRVRKQRNREAIDSFEEFKGCEEGDV